MILALAALLLAGPPAAADDSLLGPAYPIETSATFHEALLHWMDSIGALSGAGFTAGKTAQIHRQEYLDRHGEPNEQDLRLLKTFRHVRKSFVEDAARDRRDDLTLAFFEADTLDDALERAGTLLGDADLAGLRISMRHFADRYRPIWNDGRQVREFLDRSRSAELRLELGRFLERAASFFDVPAKVDPPPQLVLVPVRAGAGTHAQAIGRFLLIEIRPDDGLVDEIAPIVHENVHFLFQRMGVERLKTFQRQAAVHDDPGKKVWRLLQEALPTAIGQGVADARFREGWSAERPWYHRPEVDRYAKRIEPRIRAALEGDERFDAALMDELLALGGVAPPTP